MSYGSAASSQQSRSTKPIPLIGEGLGNAIEAFSKLLQAIEKTKHNKQDLKDFGEFVKVELDKIKHAVYEAPVACRQELDARFAGVTHLLNQATTYVEDLANQNFVKRVAVAQKAEDKLAGLKDGFKQEVLSFLMMETHRVLENQRRERKEQDRERERQQGEREAQRKEREQQQLSREKQEQELEMHRREWEQQDRERREHQRRESERVLIEKPNSIVAGTAQGKDAPSGYMHGTREELLNEFTTWAINPAGPCVLWLSGLAGTGKSSIAQSFATRLAENGIFVVSFFISRHAHHRSDLYGILHTLAFELARVHHAARASIPQAFESDPHIHELNLDKQVDKLLLQPLLAVSAADSAASTIIVLDALDECDNPEDCLGKVKLFLTSRLLHAFGAVMQPFIDRLGREVKLHEIPTTVDIRTYLKRSLSEVHRLGGLSASWPSVDDPDTLVQRAGSFFIYAAMVVRHIRQDQYTPDERLDEILHIRISSRSL
ncbi:hypothetical protein BKA62DRAFT_773665 [Auriculariales sp. MPI-PUGE-AT-0066]|nr:hypothetical protein BKA62DRAFT_773665 [Auriculariales sp. MPI-PUGE-AT-0066]